MPNSDAGPPAFPEVEPLTEVVRGAMVESRHRGAIAVVDSAGSLMYSVGDPDFRTFWRSASKPLQALPALLTGAADRFGLEPRHIAIMCGSHTGKDYHVAAIREILERAGIPESALHCEVPGRPAAPHGCSGNHAGMLVTARHMGEPLEGYEEIDHPAQQRIWRLLALLGGAAPDDVAVASDGCSVPTFGMTLGQMALSFARLADPSDIDGGTICDDVAPGDSEPHERRRGVSIRERVPDAPTSTSSTHQEEPGRPPKPSTTSSREAQGFISESPHTPGLADACRRIVAAMRACPEMLSGAEGDTRDVTSALVALKSDSLVAKTGAEALLCVAVLPGVIGDRGVGVAVRAEDGGSVQRSCYLATVEALRQLGALSADDVDALGPYLGREVTNVHGRVVGGARPCFRLRPADRQGR